MSDRMAKLYQLILNIDTAIERALDRKDPVDADLFISIRREVSCLYDDVKEMKSTLNGLINLVASPEKNKSDKVH